jgi:hypothetical protein
VKSVINILVETPKLVFYPLNIMHLALAVTPTPLLEQGYSSPSLRLKNADKEFAP